MNTIESRDLLGLLNLPEIEACKLKPGDLAVDTEPCRMAFFVEVSKPGKDPGSWIILDGLDNGCEGGESTMYEYIPKEWLNEESAERYRKYYSEQLRGLDIEGMV